MKAFRLALVPFLLGVHCGGSDKPVLTQTSLYKECVTWCYHRMQCFQDVCQEDYPGKVTTYAVSIIANGCVHDNCETDAYLNARLHQADYLACTNERSCREITTGTCNDVAVCLGSDPTSTPFLPGTHMKAPPHLM